MMSHVQIISTERCSTNVTVETGAYMLEFLPALFGLVTVIVYPVTEEIAAVIFIFENIYITSSSDFN